MEAQGTACNWHRKGRTGMGQDLSKQHSGKTGVHQKGKVAKCWDEHKVIIIRVLGYLGFRYLGFAVIFGTRVERKGEKFKGTVEKWDIG